MIVDQWKIESESSPGRYYVVSLNADESFSCSCLGWTRHVPRRDCKHIDYHRRFGGIPVEPVLMAMAKAQRKAERKVTA